MVVPQRGEPRPSRAGTPFYTLLIGAMQLLFAGEKKKNLFTVRFVASTGDVRYIEIKKWVWVVSQNSEGKSVQGKNSLGCGSEVN